MKPIAIEAVLITEHRGGLATIALNNELFEPLSLRERDTLIRTILTLTRANLVSDLEALDDERRTIELSPNKSHEEIILQLRALVTPSGEFTLLTHFGGEADPRTRLCDGLRHALEVVAICEENGQ